MRHAALPIRADELVGSLAGLMAEPSCSNPGGDCVHRNRLSSARGRARGFRPGLLAMKGGPVINLCVQDLPRFSGDIDVVALLHEKPREAGPAMGLAS